MKITTYKNNNKKISMFLLHATISYAVISVITNTTIITSAAAAAAAPPPDAVATRELPSAAAAGTTTTPACKHSTEMWGDVNPNIFYICDATTHTPQHLYCPEGRGFFKGLGYYGCIPYEQWPACISAESGGSGTDVVEVCDAEHLMEPWETMNPNKFFMCQAEARQPLLINCVAGKGFVSVVVPDGRGGSSKIVGCTEWVKWRAYMNCAEFY